MVKRESGVNPEQTRCCEFLKLLTNNATVFYGKAVRGETSQKTCQKCFSFVVLGT